MSFFKASSIGAAACVITLILALTLLCGCVNTTPRYEPSVTPGPTAAPVSQQTEAAAPTAEATEDPTPEPTLVPEGQTDAMGNRINGPEHYRRYVSFKDLVVYEEDGGTFLDGTIVNGYSKPLVCAVDIVYYDEGGGELARAQLQTRDGGYLLVLAPGDNVVFATILTDTSLLQMEYTLEFDGSVGVHPE